MKPNVIPMHNAHSPCETIKAEVKSVKDGRIIIDTGEGVVNAKKAFSCLVSPIEKDIVVVNRSRDMYYVLSILERPEMDSMSLDFPGDVTLASKTGQLNLVSLKRLNIMSLSDACITSKKFNVTSTDISVNANALKANINEINTHSKQVKFNTKILDVTAKQISQKTEVLVRWVENIETLSIGNLVQNIRNNLSSHSKQAVITASKDIRIDAERIHMG